MSLKVSKLLSGVALIGGTAIGAGTLALPTNTALPGFYPTMAIFICAWGFMTLGALLILEVNQWFPGQTNLISMSRATLGKIGKAFAWVSYLLLLYGLISAYLSALAGWLVQLSPLSTVSAWGPGNSFALLIITGLASILLFCGMGAVDKLNRYLMLGLIVSYVILIVLTVPHVHPELLEKQVNIPATFPVLPLILTTLGFAIIVPSLNSYFDNDIVLLKKVIIIGSVFPLILYIIWEFCILGTIPLEGHLGLQALKNNPHLSITDVLRRLVGSPVVGYSALVFSLCAIVTSFLGVSLSLMHFLADGLQLKIQRKVQRLLLIGTTFLPPLVMMLINPHSFDRILSFAGIFVALILGILPALMVWRGRYHQHLKGKFRVFGGKGILLMMFLFFGYVIVQELVNCGLLS